jgi:hypothetical protein
VVQHHGGMASLNREYRKIRVIPAPLQSPCKLAGAQVPDGDTCVILADCEKTTVATDDDSARVP